MKAALLLAALALAACSGPPTALPTTQPVESISTFTPPPSPLPSPLPTTTSTATQVASPRPPTSTPTQSVQAPISPENAASLAVSTTLQFDAWELVLAMAWSPDGETLAVASGEQIHLYQTSGFKERLVLEAGGWSPALAFSPDSLWIASGGRDGGLRLWDAVTGRPGFVIPAHKKGTNAVTFDPGGKWLATAGNDGMVRLWDAGNGSLKSEMIGGTFGIPAVAYTPDGEGLAIANGNVIRIRKVQDGRFVQTLRGEGSFYCLALSSRGHLLASGDSANTVLLWDWQRGEALGKMTGHSGEASRPTGLIWRVAFSPDERLLASAGGDGTMRLWDVASGELLATLSGHSAAVTSLAFSPDGVWLATGGLDARVLLWRT